MGYFFAKRFEPLRWQKHLRQNHVAAQHKPDKLLLDYSAVVHWDLIYGTAIALFGCNGKSVRP
jgi:hypothetical protein